MDFLQILKRVLATLRALNVSNFKIPQTGTSFLFES